MDVLADGPEPRQGLDGRAVHIIRMRAHVTDAPEARHLVDLLQEPREIGAAVAVAVDRLTEKEGLPGPGLHPRPHLRQDVFQGAVDLPAPHGRDDAV